MDNLYICVEAYIGEIQMMTLLFLLPCFYSMHLKKSTLDIAIAYNV